MRNYSFDIFWSATYFSVPLPFFRWLIRPGDFVHEGKTLLRYNLEAGGREGTVRADKSGVVKEIFAKCGETILEGHILCDLRDCAHDESIGGICANCGADVSALEKVRPRSRHCMPTSLSPINLRNANRGEGAHRYPAQRRGRRIPTLLASYPSNSRPSAPLISFPHKQAPLLQFVHAWNRALRIALTS